MVGVGVDVADSVLPPAWLPSSWSAVESGSWGISTTFAGSFDQLQTALHHFLPVLLCRSYSLLVAVLVVIFLGLVASMLLAEFLKVPVSRSCDRAKIF